MQEMAEKSLQPAVAGKMDSAMGEWDDDDLPPESWILVRRPVAVSLK
jgi:hypothetical protein